MTLRSPVIPKESLTIEPPASLWGERIAAHSAARRSDSFGKFSSSSAAVRFRAEIGLPTDRAVVMTGHQAAFWHPGILAKYFAADAACHDCLSRSIPAAPAWVVADQDANEPNVLAYPRLLGTDLSFGIVKNTIEAPFQFTGSGEARSSPRIAACCLPPLRAPAEPPPTDSPREIAPSLRRLWDRLNEPTDAINAARHVWSLVSSDLSEMGLAAPTVFASQLSRSVLFAEFVAHMRGDAPACVSAYNAGATAHPEAGIAPLSVENERCELPLWRLRFGRPRERVFSDQLGATPIEELAPRALVFSSLMRLAGCELFIHGFGGGGYDRVTEAWIAAWLPDERLAPTAIVSATRFLHFAGAPHPPSPGEVNRARWLAHHARHDPDVVHDDHAAARKRELLDAIASAKGNAPAIARAEFSKMHALLAEVRAAHAQALTKLDENAAAAMARRAWGMVLYERDWPYFLYAPATLAALHREVRAAFGA